MPKINTTSRLELAHLKRQLERRVKPPETVAEAPGSPIPETRVSRLIGNENSRFDYKFVFTNSAMKTEDHVFRIKNPAVTLDKELKIYKPLAPTNSFLPYGVTIRNPHMFEEDQLAVIQRRQEVHNITSPAPPYNPFMVVQRPKRAKQNRASQLLIKSPTAQRSRNRMEAKRAENDGPQKNVKNPQPDSLDSPMPGPSGGRGGKEVFRGVRTQARDSEYRQQFDALATHRTRIGLGKLNEDGSDGIQRSGQSNLSNKDVIDKLSSTVQHLNQYEERLKHYMKSKNTMAHASAALKQLQFKRSKTIAQLTKLSDQEKQQKRDMHRESPFRNITFFDGKHAVRSAGVEESRNKSIRGYSREQPRTAEGYFYSPDERNASTQKPTENERMSAISGRKDSVRKDNKNSPREKMTPLQTAMMEGLKLEKMSTLIGKRDVPPRDGPNGVPRDGPARNLQKILGSRRPKPFSADNTPSKPTTTIKHPISLLDGEVLLQPPPTAAFEKNVSLLNTTMFHTPMSENVERKTRRSHQVNKKPSMENLQASKDVGQRAYLDLRNLQTSADQESKSTPKGTNRVHPTIRRVAEFNSFLQQKALIPPRSSQKV